MHSIKASYSYKFLDDKQYVNIICKNSHEKNLHKPISFLNPQSHILSEPFQSKERPNKRNAIVGFTNDLLTEKRMEYQRRMYKEDSSNLQVVQTTVYNLREYCKVINMPMIIYINAYCTIDSKEKEHHFEIYFRYDKEEQYIKDLMKLSIHR